LSPFPHVRVLLPLGSLVGSLIAPAGLAAEAAWVQLCGPDAAQRPTVSAVHAREYLQIDGDRRRLELSDRPDPDCESLPIPTGLATVRWFGLIPEAKAMRLPRGVILQGLETDGRLQISEVVVTDPPATRRNPLPLRADLFGRLNPRAYGVEERAKANLAADSLQVNCNPGERPAGIVLRNDGARLPEAIDVSLTLDYAANATFGVGYADGADHPLDDPHLLGHLSDSPAADRITHGATFPLPSTGDRAPQNFERSTFALTLMCPDTGGSLSLSSLQLGISETDQSPPRSIWIWRPAEWLERSELLLEELEALSTPVVYVSVPMERDQVAHPDALARFVGAASERGIRVWAVEGDPHAVLPQGQVTFVQRALALMRYNAGQPPGRRLSGVQYDIEPYLLADYALHTDAWLQAYVQTIAALDDVLQIPLEIAVPFWWSSVELDNRPLLRALAPHVQSLNVMNYRTDPEQLQQFAEPFLAWGVVHDVDVRIALEAGPIRDEQRWHYRADDEGTLWHLQLADEHLLLLLDAPAALEAGTGYRFVRQSQFPGNRLTFKDDRPRMDRLMVELESLWSAWPSFAGLALHEYRLQGE
jgi:hypothetical protein